MCDCFYKSTMTIVNMETIGQRIKRLRLDRGYTRQTEFAPLVFMTQSSLSYVEAKDKEFTARQLLALAKILHVSPEYIMHGGREEDMNYLELSRIYKELSDDNRATLLKLAHALMPSANSQAA